MKSYQKYIVENVLKEEQEITLPGDSYFDPYDKNGSLLSLDDLIGLDILKDENDDSELPEVTITFDSEPVRGATRSSPAEGGVFPTAVKIGDIDLLDKDVLKLNAKPAPFIEDWAAEQVEKYYNG